MTPRLGAPPQRGRSYRRRPGAYAILPEGGRLLLTATDEVQLPGGGIDPGESPLQALHREIMEETGWRVGAPRRAGVYRRFVYMPEYDLWAEKVCHIFVARPTRQICAPLEPDHIPVWLAPEEAVALLASDGDRQFVKAFMER